MHWSLSSVEVAVSDQVFRSSAPLSLAQLVRPVWNARQVSCLEFGFPRVTCSTCRCVTCFSWEDDSPRCEGIPARSFSWDRLWLSNCCFTSESDPCRLKRMIHDRSRWWNNRVPELVSLSTFQDGPSERFQRALGWWIPSRKKTYLQYFCAISGSLVFWLFGDLEKFFNSMAITSL